MVWETEVQSQIKSYQRLQKWYLIPLCKFYALTLVGRVVANGLGDRSSITDQVIPKTSKMVLNTTLLNTKHYKVRIKCKVEQSRERSSALPYTSV